MTLSPRRSALALLVGSTFLLGACADERDGVEGDIIVTDGEMVAGDQDVQTSEGMATPETTTGRSSGVILGLDADGRYLTIAHEAFDGIQMGAMTMGFDVMSDVDISGFEEQDEVAFMVKRGRDGSYRITAICDTAAEGADCLPEMSDQ